MGAGVAELKGFDPVAYRMCEEAWEVSGDDLPSRGEIPQQWLDCLCKVPAPTLLQT